MVPAGVGWAEGWGLLLQRRGDRAHGECGGHAVPSHLALRLPIPQPQQFSWPRIGQVLGRRAASRQHPRRLNLLHYPPCLRRGRCSGSLSSPRLDRPSSSRASITFSLRAPGTMSILLPGQRPFANSRGTLGTAPRARAPETGRVRKKWGEKW